MFTFLAKVFGWIAKGVWGCFKVGFALVSKVGWFGATLIGAGTTLATAALVGSDSIVAKVFGWLLTPFATAFGYGVTVGLGVYAGKMLLGPVQAEIPGAVRAYSFGISGLAGWLGERMLRKRLW